MPENATLHELLDTYEASSHAVEIMITMEAVEDCRTSILALLGILEDENCVHIRSLVNQLAELSISQMTDSLRFMQSYESLTFDANIRISELIREQLEARRKKLTAE